MNDPVIPDVHELAMSISLDYKKALLAAHEEYPTNLYDTILLGVVQSFHKAQFIGATTAEIRKQAKNTPTHARSTSNGGR